GAGILPPGTCEGFASTYLKSRSSSSFNSEIKDFVAPLSVSITNCGAIDVTKKDDAGAALAGATFTLKKDAAPIGGTPGAEDTTVTTCTTDATGKCDFGKAIPFGDYWVVETTTPAGYTTAPPQHVTLSSANQSASLTFVDPRKFKVIVLVCQESNNQ